MSRNCGIGAKGSSYIHKLLRVLVQSVVCPNQVRKKKIWVVSIGSTILQLDLEDLGYFRRSCATASPFNFMVLGERYPPIACTLSRFESPRRRRAVNPEGAE